jgi:D-aminoacyl-tRNA deacylase
MEPLIVISKENEASQCIKSALLRMVKFDEEGRDFWRYSGFCMAEYGGRIVDIIPSHEASCYIFASTHRSESGKPCFTAHTPGNWGAADLGGNPRTLNTASASALRAAIMEMKRLSDLSLKWQVCLEAVHHGPSLGKPVLFVEVGSGPGQWQNLQAGEIAARGVIAAATAKQLPSAHVGFGGTHYCPKFTALLFEGKAFGNIISGYALERDGCDEEMVRMALSQNSEKIESTLIDWKGIKGEARRELVGTLDSIGAKWERA